MTSTVRNVLIILALAAAVAFVPGGGDSADFVGALLSTAILASFVIFGAKLYRENRVAIFSLGDQHRGLLYGGIGLIVVAMASLVRDPFDTGPGALLWLTAMVGAAAALYAVFKHYREYSF